MSLYLAIGILVWWAVIRQYWRRAFLLMWYEEVFLLVMWHFVLIMHFAFRVWEIDDTGIGARGDLK